MLVAAVNQNEVKRGASSSPGDGLRRLATPQKKLPVRGAVGKRVVEGDPAGALEVEQFAQQRPGAPAPQADLQVGTDLLLFQQLA